MNAAPPPRKFRTDDAGTFGQYTARERWPRILQNCLEDLAAEHAEGAAAAQLRELTAQVAALKADVEADRALEFFSAAEERSAHVPASFNSALASSGSRSWLAAEWLTCEIYLYRRLDVLVRAQPAWREHDVFERVKRETFRQSGRGVVELAQWFCGAATQLARSRDALEPLFREFVDISLWGNATDLSLLTNVTAAEIESLQGAQARAAAEARVLVNDTAAAWAGLSAGPPGRVDFVLDNSGFELYADLLFALFLLDAGLAAEVVFHTKDIPYMVSDTMDKDVEQLLADLEDGAFFAVGAAEREALDEVATRVRAALAAGRLRLRADSFWTEPQDFWELVPGHAVFEELRQARLVVFKGDLNYRKLTGDRRWPRETPWATALGPLARHGLRVLSLRTCKADVVVGLPAGVDERLCAEWEREGHEHGSWWATCGRWAVVSYCDGKY